MTRERLYLYDTTLRDGAQTHGADFSLEDKALIAQQLDLLGLDYIEAGYPGVNPTDTRLFAELRPLDSAKLTKDSLLLDEIDMPPPQHRTYRSAPLDKSSSSGSNLNCKTKLRP